jgi:hypothetical protein
MPKFTSKRPMHLINKPNDPDHQIEMECLMLSRETSDSSGKVILYIYRVGRRIMMRL